MSSNRTEYPMEFKKVSQTLLAKIVAAFRGMHVSPAKHSYASVTVTDGQTDRRTDDGQSDPYVALCFAGDTTKRFYLELGHRSKNVCTKALGKCTSTLHLTRRLCVNLSSLPEPL